jgi:hypothetical protein
MDPVEKTLNVFFVIIFIFFVLIFFTFFKINSTTDEYVEYILPMTFDGVVIEKYIDYRNHATKVVVVKNQNSEKIKLFNSDWIQIYENSDIGDKIYKRDGSINIFIIGSDKKEKMINYNSSNYYIHKRQWIKNMGKN